MTLSELSARELACIDAVSIEFEHWLEEQVLKQVPGATPQTDQSQADQSRADAVMARIDTLVEQFSLGAVATLGSVSQERQRYVIDALRTDLQSVAAELLGSRTSDPVFPSFHASTTAVDSRGRPASALARTPTAITASKGDSPKVNWLQAGAELGPYVVDQLIGRGGMGEVYRGHDTRLGREVAIKILVHAWADTQEHADRFAREARAVAALSHPNIVSLYDVGQYAGRPYAVMELLKGQTLREYLRGRSPLEPEEVRRIGAAAADALEVAHQAGIIHRDLKPENLFITTDGRVKLLDFGLSRSYGDELDNSDPTVTGLILGTMGYLSPEQAGGGRVTKSADLFSLGCVMHECLYGVRPFVGETTNELLAATINAAPRLDPVRAALDPSLANLIAQCLEKAAEDRPPTAGRLAQDLLDSASPGAVASGTSRASESISPVKPETPPAPPVAMPRRRWLQDIGLVAASVAGAGGIYGGYRWIFPQHDIGSIAVLPLSNAGAGPRVSPELELRALDEGEEIAAAIADQLTRIPDLRVIPFLPLREPVVGSSAGMSENLTSPDAIRRLCGQLGVDALLMGSFDIDPDGYRTIKVRLIEARKGAQIARYQIRARQEENLIAQEETAQKVAAGIGRELLAYRSGRAHANDTYHCLVNGYSRMDSESVEALRDAIKCFKSAIDQDEKFAEAYSGLALTSMLLVSQVTFEERTGLISGAREALRFATELGDRSGQPRIAESMLAWQVDWEFEKADRLFRQYVPQMPDSWVAQHEYAFFLATQGDLTNSLRYAQRAVAIDPTSTAFRVDAARLRWFSGDWQAALAELRGTAGRATGKRLELVRGATLDLLEEVGMWDEAQTLLVGDRRPFSRDDYWKAREASLKERPYGPYDDELNLLILRLRRGDKLDDATLNDIKLHRPPRLPFLLSVHPRLAELRDSKVFEEAVMQYRIM